MAQFLLDDWLFEEEWLFARRRSAWLSMAFLVFLSSEAAAVYFDFRRPDGVGNDCVLRVFCEAYTVSSGRVNVKVTADTTGPVARVNQDSSYGVGVTSGLFDQTKVDRIAYSEVLKASYPEVSLDVLTLSLVDWNDDVSLLIDGDPILGSGIDIPGTGNTDIDLARFLPDPSDRTGVIIGLTTADWTDNFKVAAIDVNPAFIHSPEPSTLLLASIGVGIFGFAIYRNRRGNVARPTRNVARPASNV